MVKQIDVTELARRQAAGEATYLLDVRQPWEHDLAALPDSQLIPLGELPARLRSKTIPFMVPAPAMRSLT